MNTSLSGKFSTLRSLGTGLLMAGITLLSVTTVADAGDAKPTAAEISKARGDCAAHKRKVHAMENSNENDPELPAARAAWASACGHAQDLISAASGTPPPEPAPAPAPDPNAADATQSAPAN